MTRVLLLEDDFSLSFNIKALLTEHGMDVDVRTVASDAIKCFESETYDLVIVDLIIYEDERPSTDGGVILISWLKSPAQKNEALRAIPILCVSGATKQPGLYHLLDMARSLGADACLEKPFNDVQLIDTVSRLIEGRPVDGPTSRLS
ncbi:response regulator [Roseobacter sinensis]|uniref:Response regulator n=1 Tax=Roseobacter sinensis TaxID=2931391 RepID=A0ABT3BGN7_9RHOB|nr:response regulator [Roseobacter sp. WL0113]MCV3272751.1 response regulator [Roseobacter sp. WL0113]